MEDAVNHVAEALKPVVQAGGRIVLCGSMAFSEDMSRIKAILADHGVECVGPEALDTEAETGEAPLGREYKRKVSRIHMDKVKAPSTAAILVANFDKHGIPGYVGPNTFAEIAVAFSQNKPIFLLNGLPDVYVDELSAWGAVDLRAVPEKDWTAVLATNP